MKADPRRRTRLGELHQQIGYYVERGDLAQIRQPAEELALVAKRAKTLTRGGLPAEKRTKADRLCTELIDSSRPIKGAADAGKNAEAEAIVLKIGAAVDQLLDLAK